MTREEAITYGERKKARIQAKLCRDGSSYGDHSIHYSEAEFTSAAVAALREQEERERGCEYCQQFDDPCSAPMIAAEESDIDRGIYLYNNFLCANGGEFCEAEINFCPMCGWRLYLPKPTTTEANN